MSNNNEPLVVSIMCLAYNHEPYIRQCLEGFVMQKTNFRFEAIVHDDASIDGTTAIIREFEKKYPDIIKPIYECENQYSKRDGSIERIMDNACKGKYIALCEGDDYWIDPLKLQKQVDYLNSHPNCGLVYTAYRKKNEVTGQILDISTAASIKFDDTFKWSVLEQKVMVGTCTTMFKSDLYKEIKTIKDDFIGFLMGDTQLWFHFARLSSVGYIPEVMCVYRKNENGVTAGFNPTRRATFIRNCLDLHLHLGYKYGAPKRTIDNIKTAFGRSLMQIYLSAQDYPKAQDINRSIFNNNIIIEQVLILTKKLKLKRIVGLRTLVMLLRMVKVLELR